MAKIHGESAAKIKDFVRLIYEQDFKEVPVGITTFLKDDYFIGRTTRNGATIYPGWYPVLEDIFSDDERYLVVVSGAIGVGKTALACQYCMLYILYRLMCHRDPWGLFGLQDSGKMEVAFFNLTKSLSSSRGFAYMQNALQNSPWFREHGLIMRGKHEPYAELPLFQWVLASPYAKGFGMLGGNVIAAVMDEVDSPNESEGQKKRVVQAYQAAIRRFESRFVKDGASMGRMFLVASKQDELSFLEALIAEMRKTKKVRIYEKSQWEIKPAANYSGERFWVSLGDPYTPPKILKDTQERDKMIRDGFKVTDIPEEHRFEFEQDIIGALRDLAGMTVHGIRKTKLIPAERFIRECLNESYSDPVSSPSIQIGLQDEIEIIQFVNLALLRSPRGVPRFIHTDIGVAHDCLAMAMSCISGWTDIYKENEEGTFTTRRMPIVDTELIIRLQARENDRIPLHKMRKFILDLKAAGVNVTLATFDLLLASEDTIQILTKAKVNTGYLSVDKDIKPYLDLRNMIFEKRWVSHFHPWAFFELKHLEYDRTKNKIDHPDKIKDLEILPDGRVNEIVMMGSKDVSDAIAGSAYNAITAGKEPVDVQKHIQQIEALKDKNRPQTLPTDWFISQKSKDQLLQNKDVLMFKDRITQENAEKLKAALRKLKGGR